MLEIQPITAFRPLANLGRQSDMAELVNQPTPAPTRKVSAAGLSTVVSIILTWVWTEFVPSHPMPPEVAAAIGGILAFIAGYAMKERVPP